MSNDFIFNLGHPPTYSGGASGTTSYIHADWLGTERVRTGVSGAVSETCTSLAFGDGQSCTGTDVSPMHFTGKQRDTETGNDDFGARYYSSSFGRWMTPDWSAREEADPYADMSNPQTLDLYGYAGNDPTTHTDPDGHAQSVSSETHPGVGCNVYPAGGTCTSSTTNDQTSANAQAQQTTVSTNQVGYVTVWDAGGTSQIYVGAVNTTTVTTYNSDGSVASTQTTRTVTVWENHFGNDQGKVLYAAQYTNGATSAGKYIDPAVAASIIGNHAISQARDMATRPDYVDAYVHTQAQDIVRHPGRYLLHAAGLAAAPALGLGEDVDGVITAIHALHTAAELEEEKQ